MSSGQDGPEAGVSQDIQAERDAFTAGHDLTVIYQYASSPAGTGEARAAGPTRRLRGNVPPRNPGFVGREEILSRIRTGLLAGHRTAVQVLQGMGGVGKTQLAVEYAHRFADSYDVTWWIGADQAALIGNQFAELAENLGCVESGAGLTDAARQATLAELRQGGQWLLVFDNAESPVDLTPWLPGGNGHVLITSRTRRWADIAVPVEVDVLTRAESVAILRTRVSWLSEPDAEKVAAALGDLPLGVTQATGYMTDTGTPADAYLSVLETRAGQVLDLGWPSSYQQSLSAVTQLAFDRLGRDDPASAALVAACAFLAPVPVPVEWFTGNSAPLPVALASAAADPLTWHQALARISASALARIDPEGLRMHRLTQAIVRGYLSAEQSTASRQAAEAVVAASHPGDGRTPDVWPEWTRLLPHLTFLHPELAANPGLRQLAVDATYYLLRRGYWQSSYDLADQLYQKWADQLGPDDPWTLAAAQAVGIALWKLGRHDEAAQFDQDTLARRRRVLGEDHPETLVSANATAIILRQLGQMEAARELDEDTLARRRRVLGADHPQTLMSANTMTVILRGLDQNEAARDLAEDTLARRRRVLGEDHPDTLISANNLALVLRAVGQVQAARDLAEDTLARRRRVLGEDHPDTLISASNLAALLRAARQPQAARELDEDTLARRRRVLGEDHPDTQRSAARLAADDDDDDDDDWDDDEELQPEDMPSG
jgi:tetratricopeptide (TPR) repeat protein